MAFVEGLFCTQTTIQLRPGCLTFVQVYLTVGLSSGVVVRSYAWVLAAVDVYLFPCRVCVPKSAEKKHHYIAHEPLKCECGIQTTQVRI